MECEQLEAVPTELPPLLSGPDLQVRAENAGDLVHQVRRLRAAGQTEEAQGLCMRLLQYCEPMFHAIARGFSHDPMLHEDVLSAMRVRVLCEVCDPREVFMTKNFKHTARMICFDVVKGAMRGERRTLVGTAKTRKQQWYLVQHGPSGPSEDGKPEVLDGYDYIDEVHVCDEVSRILSYLPDVVDRRIVVLRAIEEKKWDDIALLCDFCARSVQNKYKAACLRLRECLLKEQEQEPLLSALCEKNGAFR